MNDQDRYTLTHQQLTRLVIAQGARGVIGSRSMIGSAAVDVIDVIALSRYVETGEDPYLTNAKDDRK